MLVIIKVTFWTSPGFFALGNIRGISNYPRIISIMKRVVLLRLYECSGSNSVHI